MKLFLMPKQRYAWFGGSLFWRTFILIGFIITVSMAAWVASSHYLERGPKAQQMAARVISTVTITRAALTHSRPTWRSELLFELSSNEGIRIYSLESNDRIEPLRDLSLMPDLENLVQAALGKNTKIAGRVNGMAGFWVSFKIDDDDEYWLMLESRRLGSSQGWQWLGGAGVVLLLSLLGGLIISSLINLPLARISAAAKAIANGEEPKPLPETGSSEINETNRSFNQMVADLKRIESDRALILAGISHDLRTPLARMQLEIEMANLSDEARDGMQSDIAQMDAIIGQFLDFAKPTEVSNFIKINFSELVADITQDAERLPDIKISTQIESEVHVDGHAIDLRRVVNNLIENARRYGRTPNTNLLELDFLCRLETTATGKRAVLEVADHGVGAPEDEIQQLRKPFTRLDASRSQANGAGLGLAIVDRVIMRHGGQLTLANRPNGGFLVRIELPCSKSK